ncbi:hypothetical protein Rsub_12275 [Raphidocelis subcapitata]|uniref:Uncharacterized protein n=1 Tax=Raphidocelis subcapitata TaxID=307507 RepID=A0A2V0PPU0_9CHLO|nr:hypothetical protein Rsub_12275 [Raphidocelis subcapitata]|eukprot:GBF99497.1 hypothetical protein Rsub_12275 [Raphidocelis subcapitata]
MNRSRLGLLAALLAAAACCRAVTAAEAGDAAGAGAGAGAGGPAAAIARAQQLAERYPVEAALIGVLLLYLLSVFFGRRENLLHAMEWSEAFAAPDTSLLAQQFSHHGYVGLKTKDKDSFYWRESPSEFKFWGSGRRFCEGALVTVATPPRHDWLRRLLPGQSEARVEVEVWMAEGAMPPLVLAVAPPKPMRQLAKSNADVKDFAKRVEVARDRLPLWPGAGAAAGASGSGAAGGGGGKGLVVMAETAAAFYDLFGDARVQAAVAREPLVLQHLRSIVFTSEGGLGQPSRKLLFTFNLPPPGRVEELRPCMNLVFLLLDQVGGYKLSADAQSKAAALRQQVEAARSERRAREDGGGAGAGGGGPHAERQLAAMQRRMERLAEERERARRQGPAALEKFEERLRKQQMKKAMKSRTVKA